MCQAVPQFQHLDGTLCRKTEFYFLRSHLFFQNIYWDSHTTIFVYWVLFTSCNLRVEFVEIVVHNVCSLFPREISSLEGQWASGLCRTLDDVVYTKTTVGLVHSLMSPHRVCIPHTKLIWTRISGSNNLPTSAILVPIICSNKDIHLA